MVAEKLVKTIAKGEINIDAIDVRARALGINMNVLDRALEKLHKMKTIKRSVRAGTVWYSVQIIKKKDPTAHLTWVNANYPPMTSENDGSGIEADYSYLFLTPEEMEKYKAEVAGRAYVPKRKHERKKKPVMTQGQLDLMSMFPA